MKSFIIYSLFVLVIFDFTSAQSIRTLGMGGMQFSITDYENEITPFDLSGNPAWLYKDELNSYLKISPSIKSSRGDYKRLYDAKTNNLYGVEFKGIKTLGSDGTFLGQTSYIYDYRKNVSRSLKYDTYSGEAFFFNDTTTGNIRYTGPHVNLMYSFQLLPGLFTGGSISYAILDGLKNIYSRSETLLREVAGNAGLAYMFSDDLILAANLIYHDNQEKITADSEDLLEVEIFNFKGETFSIRRRSSTVEQKIRTKGNTIGSQIYYKPFESMQFGISGAYDLTKQKILIPYSVEGQSFSEYEIGYSSFNDYFLLLKGNYKMNDKLLLGITGSYSREYVWSKNPAAELLLWEWEIKQAAAGVGASYRIIPALMLAFEYEFQNVNGDSAKYIDSRKSLLKSNNHLLRAGGELEILDNVFVRAGYNLSLFEEDLFYGGKDVILHSISLGAGLNIFSAFSIDIYIKMGSLKPSQSELSRNNFESFITAKLFTF